MAIERRYLFASSIGTVAFDVAIDETHTSTTAVSQYPVERGAPLIDHTYPQPDVLTLNLAHGLTPLFQVNEQGNSIRLVDFFDKIKIVQANGELVEIITGVRRYQDMVITNIVAVRGKGNVSTMTLTVNLQQVRRVTLAETDNFNRRFSELVEVNRRAAAQADLGDQAATELATDSAEATNNASFLKQLKDAIVNRLSN